MAGGGGGDGEPEFQVAPMIDVLLTILIFFMTITSAQVLKVDKSIKLPIAPDAQKPDNQRAQAVINVRWNPAAKKAQFVFDDKAYDQSALLVPLLKHAREVGEKKITANQNPTFRALIRGDREVPALHVSLAMNAAAEAGISDISFSTVNKD
ncbi:MAG: biopolymer transporter ExbD [Chthoniobacter sp.]|nr:biopolymer transporter ExbD [Chthoniobacter sp.]